MERNGIEWKGMERNGMEWNGKEWNGKEWNGKEWKGKEWNGKEWMNEWMNEWMTDWLNEWMNEWILFLCCNIHTIIIPIIGNSNLDFAWFCGVYSWKLFQKLPSPSFTHATVNVNTRISHKFKSFQAARALEASPFSIFQLFGRHGSDWCVWQVGTPGEFSATLAQPPLWTRGRVCRHPQVAGRWPVRRECWDQFLPTPSWHWTR